MRDIGHADARAIGKTALKPVIVKSLCSELLACSRSNTGVAAADKDAELDRAVQMQLHEDASAADGAHAPPRVF